MTSRPPPRTGRDRIKTLAQAALNADVTVDQLDTILTQMSESLTDLNTTMSGMNGTLEYFEETLGVFNSTLTRIDELAPPGSTRWSSEWKGSSTASSASWESVRR